ncbi:MAG TPA: hypothetical protein VHV75_09515 [Solirubrobacteraceae bacterium]|jgi:hypothetical protein|nr:hypothetical protein [Solirubrobacteraceae bacterium]
MPKFLLTFRGPSEPVAPDPDASAAWMQWFGQINDSVIEMGDGVGAAHRVGNVEGGSQRVGGYTIIEAADLNAAAKIASSSPPVADGYGVEVGQLLEILANVPASGATA